MLIEPMEKLKADKMKQTPEQASTDRDPIRRVIAAVQAATHRRGFWATARGASALKYLQAWGAVQRERRLTGDPTAVPRGLAGSGIGMRSVDAQSSIGQAHDSVERWMAERTPLERKLLRWIHRDGTEDQVLAVVYRLASGSISDPCLISEPVPPAFMAYERVITVAEGHVQTCKLADFPGWMPFRGVLAMWGVAWTDFLEWVHERLGERIAKDLNL